MFKSLFKKNKEVELAPEAEQEETSPVQEAPQPEKKSWLQRLKGGLSKSSNLIGGGISGIFTKRKLDNEAIEELEELLIMADLGVETATSITSRIAKNRFDKEISPEEIKEALAQEVSAILEPVTKPLEIPASNSPHVIVMVGVNGNGKTTTMGKIAKQLTGEGKKVMFAACDTFRAAAVEQLNVWAERTGCPIVTGKDQADPASVAYTALERAKAEGQDVLLIDTAGRLQNKTNLMEELVKILRVLKKLDEHAPHQILLVLDATTGQNAFKQVQTFKEMVNISGLIVTKLDGTAKGGVVVGLADKFKLPILAIGVGEGVEDLHAFDAASFAQNLVGIDA